MAPKPKAAVRLHKYGQIWIVQLASFIEFMEISS
jgi:hypothetical protein